MRIPDIEPTERIEGDKRAGIRRSGAVEETNGWTLGMSGLLRLYWKSRPDLGVLKIFPVVLRLGRSLNPPSTRSSSLAAVPPVPQVGTVGDFLLLVRLRGKERDTARGGTEYGW